MSGDTLILESIVTKSSASALGKAVRSVACLIGKQALNRGTSELIDRMLSPVLQKASPTLSILEQALFALSLADSELVDLNSFLASNTFEALIRSVGVLYGTPTFETVHVESLRAQKEILTSYLIKVLPQVSAGTVTIFSETLFRFIEAAVPEAWRAATENGLIATVGLSEAAVQNQVLDYIANSRKQVQQTIASSGASFREIDVFAERYKRGVQFSTSKLKPQSVQDSPSVPINLLYVEPLVAAMTDQPTAPCHRDSLLACATRSVLLGNPGGGKSTLVGKLCFDVCSDSIDRHATDVPEMAAQVVLRDYGQYQRTNPCSIIEYLELHSKSEYQIECPPGALKLLLLAGRILIVFDGLDELIETKDRLTVRSAVEHFALEYPVAPIVVTSREVGYEQAPLDRTQFAHFKLSPFGEKQVVEYAAKWFQYSCSPNVEEGKRLAESFVDDSAIVPDIRSNPLMFTRPHAHGARLLDSASVQFFQIWKRYKMQGMIWLALR